MDILVTMRMLRLFSRGNFVVAFVKDRDARGFATKFSMQCKTKNKKKALAYKKSLEDAGQSCFIIGFSKKIIEQIDPAEVAEFYRQYYSL